MALMPVAEALARVLADAAPLPAEHVPLDEAHGRVLAEDLAALRTQPPADVSAMDGYAVRAADVANVPATLDVIGEVAAGHPFDGAVGAGEAARIFTGGVLPAGADTVVIQEITARDGDRVIVEQPPAKGRNVRAPGLDFSARRGAAAQGPPPHRPRPDAGRRDEPPARRRCIAGPRSRCSAPATSWCRRAATPRPGRDRLFQRLCARWRWRAAKAPRCIDLGIVPRPASRTSPRAIRRARDWRRRHPGHDRRRLGRRPRPGAARRCAAEGLDLSFWRVALRPGRPMMHGRLGAHAGARPARQSGVVLCLRVPVPGAADPAARRPRRPRAAARIGACSAATCRPTTSAPTICARRSTPARMAPSRRRCRSRTVPMMAPLAKADCLRDSRAARARGGRPVRPASSLSSRL